MALSNLSNEPSAAKRGPDCTVCQALVELPKAQAMALDSALRNPRWRFTEIANELATDTEAPEWVRGIQDQTLSRHAQGRCAARTKLRGGTK